MNKKERQKNIFSLHVIKIYEKQAPRKVDTSLAEELINGTLTIEDI